jgi:epsilon-lactone hydrolase
MASLRSKFLELFLSPFYSKKANLSAELNIKFSRLIEAPFPPKKIYKKNRVVTTRINGRNIFTIVPKTLYYNNIIFYLHGGAYIVGITWPHWHFINKLSNKAGIKVAVLDYPIAPENSYIDTFNMAVSAYEALLQDYSHSHIIFMGDSAGGGLALALAQALKKKHLPQPSQIILLSPWLDVTLSNPDIACFEKMDKLLSKNALITAGNHYAKDTDRKDPLISPIYGDFEGLADIHLFIGNHDLLAADARKLKARVDNDNGAFNYYEFDKMFHVWMFFPIPEAKAAMNKILGILSSINDKKAIKAT